MHDKIIVKDLLLRGIIGLNDWEREKPQDILPGNVKDQHYEKDEPRHVDIIFKFRRKAASQDHFSGGKQEASAVKSREGKNVYQTQVQVDQGKKGKERPDSFPGRFPGH